MPNSMQAQTSSITLTEGSGTPPIRSVRRDCRVAAVKERGALRAGIGRGRLELRVTQSTRARVQRKLAFYPRRFRVFRVHRLQA